MSSDETQFGLKLTGVLRPKVEEKSRPSTGEKPASGKLAQRIPDASGRTKKTDVEAAVIKPASPALAALWRGPVAPEPTKHAEQAQQADAEYLQSLSAAADGHRFRRKSGHSRTLYWLMGLGISMVTAGLLICWVYWQPLSALLIGGPVATAPQGTVAIAGPNAQPSPTIGVPVAKSVAAANLSGAEPPAGPIGVNAGVATVIKPAAEAPLVKPVAKPAAHKQPPVATRLDLDHPFFQRIKGPFPQLFKTPTGN